MFDNCTQDWFAVASVIEDLLSTLKESCPHINEAFIRSDNAGCYHCGPLMLAIPEISKRTGVMIRRYDFSDAQAGKDICDRRIASAKSHMRRFLNEGNNINTASDMKKALDSYGGVKGCRASVVSVDTTKQQIFKHKWTGITSFNNFQFLKSGIRVWKAYKIGKGKLITKKELLQMAPTQGKTGLVTKEPFTTPEEDAGLLKKSSTKQCQPTEPEDSNVLNERENSKGFYCPNVSCVKVFVTSRALEKHLDVGKHFFRLQSKGTYDTIKQKWSLKCTSISTYTQDTQPSEQMETTVAHPSSAGSEMGWALRKSSAKVRFSKPIKEFLLKIFLEGEKSRKKADPKEVSTRIKHMKRKGKKVFDKSQWLSAQQVKSYFSRLSVLQRSGKLKDHQGDEDEDQEIDMLEDAIGRQNLMDCVREEVEI